MASSRHRAPESVPATDLRARLGIAIWTLFALVMALTVLPAGWGLGGWPVLLQLVSFPLVFGLALAVLAVVLLVRGRRRFGAARRARIGSGLVVAVVALSQVFGVVSRGWWSSGEPTRPGDIVVVSFNAAHISPLPPELTDIVLLYQPQIIALPETTGEVARVLAAAAKARGIDYQVFSGTTVSVPPSTSSLLVATSLGSYAEDTPGSRDDGVVRAVPVAGGGPVVVAVHPTSPQLIGLDATTWQAAGRAAVAECSTVPDAIVAGDFNATLAHPQFSDLGRCRDAAAEIRRSAEGTWPAWMPAPFASPIDHVLVDGDRWKVVDFTTRKIGHSDHRLVMATVRRR